MKTRTRPLIGIDLGTTEIRAVRVAAPKLGTDGKVTVTDVAAHPITDEAINEGRILSVPGVTAALDDVLEQIGARRGAPLAVTVSGKFTGIDVRAIPSSFRPSEWADATRSGLGQLTANLSATEAELSIVPIDIGPDWTTLAIAGVHRDLLEQIRRAVAGTRGHLALVEPSASALLRSHLHLDHGTHGTLVNIGASQTTVIGRHGPNLAYVEVISDGVASVVGALTAEHSFAVSDADLLARNLVAVDRPAAVAASSTAFDQFDGALDAPTTGPAGTGNPLQDEYGPTFTDAVDNLVDAIAGAIEASADDPSRPNVQMPDGVSLTGRGALLGGLPRRVEARLGLPCHGALPWAQFKVTETTRPFMRPDPTGDGLYVPSDTYHRFGIAIGAAMNPLL